MGSHMLSGDTFIYMWTAMQGSHHRLCVWIWSLPFSSFNPRFFLYNVVPPVPLTARHCARRAAWPFLSLEQLMLCNVFCSWFLFFVLWILTTFFFHPLCRSTESFTLCLRTAGYYSSYYLSELQSPHVPWRNKAARRSQRWEQRRECQFPAIGSEDSFFPAGED